MNVISASPLPPVAPNQWNAFGGIWRLALGRFLAPGHWLALIGMLVVLGLIAMAAVQGGTARYLPWISEFYLTFVVPMIAFISAAGAMRDEMKPGAVDYIFTRPVRRSAFVPFKYLAHLAWAQIDYFPAFAVVIGVGLYYDVPGLLAAIPLLFLAQAIVIMAFSALGFLCGVLTSRYVVVGLFYGAIVEIGVGQIPTQLNRLSMIHQVRVMLEPLQTAVGDAVAQVTTKLGSGHTVALNAQSSLESNPGVLTTTGILLVYSVLMLGFAAVIFGMQELGSAKTQET